MTSTSVDFSKGARGAVIASHGKTRVTIMLDDDVIEAFRARAEKAGSGYQTMINQALRQSLDPESAPVTLADLRRLIGAEKPNKIAPKAKRQQAVA